MTFGKTVLVICQGMLTSLSASLVLDSFLSARAEIYRDVDLEGSVSITEESGSDVDKYQRCIKHISEDVPSVWKLTDDEHSYITLCKGTPEAPRITTVHHCGPGRSLVIQYLNNIDNIGDSQKIQFWYGQQDFNKPLWTGFAIKIGNNSGVGRFESPDNPGDWVILTQWWQGGGSIPPMRLTVQPGATSNLLNWSIVINNGKNTLQNVPGGGFITHIPNKGISPFAGTIRKGKWNTFLFENKFTLPESRSQGYVKVWQNGIPIKVVNANTTTWRGYVGYNVIKTPNYTPPPDLFGVPGYPLQGLAFKQGIYRALSDPPKYQTVFFDNLKVTGGANGKAEANPGAACPAGTI